jgi:hypothetical protein
MTLGGPTPIGARKANLSDEVLPYIEEIALNEQVRVVTSVRWDYQLSNRAGTLWIMSDGL